MHSRGQMGGFHPWPVKAGGIEELPWNPSGIDVRR